MWYYYSPAIYGSVLLLSVCENVQTSAHSFPSLTNEKLKIKIPRNAFLQAESNIRSIDIMINTFWSHWINERMNEWNGHTNENHILTSI